MKIGLNLSGISYSSSQLPFLNIFKMGVGWGTLNNGTGTGESVLLYTSFLDSNGYPTTLTGGVTHTFNQVNTLLLRDLSSIDGGGGTYPAGTYIFLYDGTGTFSFSDDFTKVTETAQNGSAGTGRIVLTAVPTTTGTFVTLLTTGSGAAYAKNFRLVYSPDSTSSVIGTREALLNSGEIFNPDFISRIKEFKTLRFMDWMATTNNFQTNWSDRPTQGYAFWAGSPTNATINGADPRTDQTGINDGVPAEVMFALCNEIGADGWFCMPALATNDYITQFATLAHTTLNKGVNVYVEFANEVWNGVFASQQSGSIGAAPLNNNNVLTQMAQAGWALFPALNGNVGQGAIDYGVYQAIKTRVLWRTAWGADSGRLTCGWGGWNGNPSFASFWLALLSTNNGGPSTWYTGAPNPTGSLGQNVDALYVAPYFNYETPDGWNLDQLFVEITTGSLPQSSTGTVGGTTTAYTLTTGLSLPSPPPNNTIIAITIGAALTNGSNCTLATDGGSAHPLQLNDGSASGTALPSSTFTPGNTYLIAYTSSINGVAVTTPGWRYFLAGVGGNASGMVQEALSAVSTNKTTANSYSIPLLGYEGGQQLLAGGGASNNAVLQSLITAANRDPRFFNVYETFFAGWNSAGGGVICHYNDIGGWTTFGLWGLLENVSNQHSSKYDAVLQEINPNRRGSNVKGGF